jgi:transitional endoplasmic reticulum ATPase
MTDPETRVRALREAVRVAPTDATLMRMLAEAEAAAGEPTAVDTFREALTLQPHDAATMLGLARAYVSVGKLGAALVVLEDRGQHVPDDPIASLLKARILTDLQRLPEAAAAYRDAVAADPAVADLDLAMRIGAAVDLDVDGGTDGGHDESVAGSPVDDMPADDGPLERIPVAADGPGRTLDADDRAIDIERPRITFADVGGMEMVKDEIRNKIIHPLEQPELYAAYGQQAGGGILLYGPPGCGKTHLARATAGEVRAAFLAVGISDVLDMWIGSSEKNLRGIFDGARAHRPAVLFFDEVDALAAKRTDFHGASGRNVVNQFLAELDGIDADNERLLVLAATNAPWHLDPAFRRPGRFDRVIFVPPPDRPARAAILAIHLRDRPTRDVDVDAIAERTDGFSGADLKGIVDVAVSDRLAEAIKVGIPVPVTTRDLLAAVKKVKPSTTEWFATARNYVLYANEAGLYDPVRPFLRL